jgi:hypothetical protein
MTELTEKEAMEEMAVSLKNERTKLGVQERIQKRLNFMNADNDLHIGRIQSRFKELNAIIKILEELINESKN